MTVGEILVLLLLCEVGVFIGTCYIIRWLLRPPTKKEIALWEKLRHEA